MYVVNVKVLSCISQLFQAPSHEYQGKPRCEAKHGSPGRKGEPWRKLEGRESSRNGLLPQREALGPAWVKRTEASRPAPSTPSPHLAPRLPATTLPAPPQQPGAPPQSPRALETPPGCLPGLLRLQA